MVTRTKSLHTKQSLRRPTVSDCITMNGTRYLSAKEAARVADLCYDYILRFCRHGEVKATKISGFWYVSEPSLRSLLVEKENRKARHRARLAELRTHEIRVARRQRSMLASPLPFRFFS